LPVQIGVCQVHSAKVVRRHIESLEVMMREVTTGVIDVVTLTVQSAEATKANSRAP